MSRQVKEKEVNEGRNVDHKTETVTMDILIPNCHHDVHHIHYTATVRRERCVRAT